MNSAPPDPLIGRTLDQRYVVRSRIARGGMAVVYLGDDLRLGRLVAIKVMHSHLADDENFTRRFEQEARSAALLAHPNVVSVFDQGESGGVPYLVMEYLPGITLRELLKQQRQLTPEQAAEIAQAVLSGLAAAHEAGIVHRDLKPENVLLADDGRIKIGDFGLARAVSANTTTGQALLGTIAYLSPELVTRGIADARSDLYAFGIVFYEMLTGSQPYKGDQPMQIAYQHAHSDVPLPSTVVPGIPTGFDELVRWTTQRDAAARPSDAREALEYLGSISLDDVASATTVLPATRAFTSVTPATTVLSNAERLGLADGQAAGVANHGIEDGPAVMRATRAVGKRARRGRITAALLAIFVAASGTAGWWWGQGPGSTVQVPKVAGLTIVQAKQSLTEKSLLIDLFDCTSPVIAEGLAVRSEPESGTTVDRGSTVRVCKSIGPEILPVPALAGLPLQEAISTIEENRFVFGEVREERFVDAEAGTVILATDTEGEALGETYPEQAVIDLIVSAGPLPDLVGNTVEQATSNLAAVGLQVDSTKNKSDYNDDVAEGHVIRIVHDDIVRKGDSVGLFLSLGKQLVEIPAVKGMKLREAMEKLSALGLEPKTALPEALWDAAEVSHNTEPGAGERVPLGTAVRVRASI